jgi:hypothetical protein
MLPPDHARFPRKFFTSCHFSNQATWLRHAQHFLLSTASLSILGDEQNSTKESAIVWWNAVSNNTVDPGPDQRTRDNGTTANAKAIERWDNQGGETDPLE